MYVFKFMVFFSLTVVACICFHVYTYVSLNKTFSLCIMLLVCMFSGIVILCCIISWHLLPGEDCFSCWLELYSMTLLHTMLNMNVCGNCSCALLFFNSLESCWYFLMNSLWKWGVPVTVCMCVCARICECVYMCLCIAYMFVCVCLYFHVFHFHLESTPSDLLKFYPIITFMTATDLSTLIMICII